MPCGIISSSSVPSAVIRQPVFKKNFLLVDAYFWLRPDTADTIMIETFHWMYWFTCKWYRWGEPFIGFFFLFPLYLAWSCSVGIPINTDFITSCCQTRYLFFNWFFKKFELILTIIDDIHSGLIYWQIIQFHSFVTYLSMSFQKRNKKLKKLLA